MADMSGKLPIEAVGLSISRCILVLAEGRIPGGAVRKIIGGTLFDDLDSMWQEYSQKYWSSCTLRARTVFYQFVEKNGIDQPRLRGEEPPDSSGGIWMVGARQYETAALKELFDISDVFLKMPASSRDSLLGMLPPDAVTALTDSILKGNLKTLMPDFAARAAGTPKEETARLIVGRIREFLAAAPDFQPPELYPELLQALLPYIRMRTAEKSVVSTKTERPVQFSQIRKAVRLPDSGK